MSQASIVIRTEHRNLASVLNCLRNVVRDIDEHGSVPNFDLFDSIYDYIERFLNTYHHPKENDYLFKALRRRDPDMSGTLDELETQHKRHAPLVRELRDKTEDYREGGAQSFGPFKKAVETYLQAEWDHMRLEEDAVLPAAEKALSAQDWQEIDAAFLANEDPIFGDRPKAEFKALLHRIASAAPAPYGLGAGRDAGA